MDANDIALLSRESLLVVGAAAVTSPLANLQFLNVNLNRQPQHVLYKVEEVSRRTIADDHGNLKREYDEEPVNGVEGESAPTVTWKSQLVHHSPS